MKAIQSIGRFLPGVIISFALITSSFEVSSQNNGNHKSDKNKDRKEYRNDHSKSSDYSSQRNDGRKDDNKHYNKHSKDRHDGNYQYSQRYSKKSYHAERDYFNHPKYGRVYQRFDDKPIVFRHSHGDYYYSGNQFYTYRDGVGYCAAETPRKVYFRDLPFSCSRVHVNNHVYFRHGDLYFSHSPRGYVLVPSPIEVSFSVRF